MLTIAGQDSSNEVDTIMDDYDDNSAISDDYSNEFSSIDDSLDGSDDYDYGSIDDSGSDYDDMHRYEKFRRFSTVPKLN